MSSKKHSYEGKEISIEYDSRRCIHAAECVKALPGVFNPDARPWVNAGGADAQRIMDTVRACPTGALAYRTENPELKEQPPGINSVYVCVDGPVYLRGDIEVLDAEGDVVSKETRVALCRCGKSANKPFCDNAHLQDSFSAGASANTERMPVEEHPKFGKLRLKLLKNGPVLLDGTYQFYSSVVQPFVSSKNIALCRCGASANKPFCDGTHKLIGFTTE